MTLARTSTLFLALALPASALAGSWTTGEVVDHLWGGDMIAYEADIPAVESATLTLKYGLWNSPDVQFDLYVNGEYVFDVLADAGYSSPGPAYEEAEVGHLLVAGVNVIEVFAKDDSTGEAVVGAVTIDFVEGEGGPTLSAEGSCPGIMDLSVTGMTGDGSWALISSSGEGTATVPGGPCAGVGLGLSSTGMALRSIMTADAAGEGGMSPSIPASACGAAIQALDLTTCTPTNVVILD